MTKFTTVRQTIWCHYWHCQQQQQWTSCYSNGRDSLHHLRTWIVLSYLPCMCTPITLHGPKYHMIQNGISPVKIPRLYNSLLFQINSKIQCGNKSEVNFTHYSGVNCCKWTKTRNSHSCFIPLSLSLKLPNIFVTFSWQWPQLPQPTFNSLTSRDYKWTQWSWTFSALSATTPVNITFGCCACRLMWDDFAAVTASLFLDLLPAATSWSAAGREGVIITFGGWNTQNQKLHPHWASHFR